MLDPDCSTPQTKTCKKCGETKPADRFQPGYRSCLDCKREYQRAYHIANRERLNAYGREYRAENREHLREQQRQFREANGAKLCAKARESYAKSAQARRDQKKTYRAENADKCREAVRQYHRRHRAEMNAYRKEWIKRNPGKQAEYQGKWNENNPDVIRDCAARRRARMLNAPEVERISRAALWERDGGRCHICGKKCDPKNWHADHLIPLSKGGSHTMANLAVSHPTCNLKKWCTGPAQLRLI